MTEEDSLIHRQIDKIEKLEVENKKLRKVLKECDDYLSRNKLNSICTGSILHRQIRLSLKE